MIYKRIKDRLNISMSYFPNGYFDNNDDYVLIVNVNGNSYTISPFGVTIKDLTINQLLLEIKDILEEVIL